ncbi:MAG: alpha/beta fold hydrolase [Candidatus Eutrophobiaceae bacterium]
MSVGAGDFEQKEKEKDWRTPPGELHEVFGYSMHLDCQGEGTPVVILEAGMGGFSLEWIHVQSDLAKLTKVCSYDRAGYGWSFPSPYPRSIDRLAEELLELLKVAEVSSPYVFVGHSFGGFNALYMARAYSKLTAGLILVDASHPDQFESLPELPMEREKREMMDFLPNRRWMSIVSVDSVRRVFPERIANTVILLMGQPKALYTHRREAQMFRYNGALLKQDWNFPPFLLRVISRGRREWGDDPRGEYLETAWIGMQRKLGELSPHGRLVVASGSGHMVPLERPDVVVREIKELVDEWREKCTHRHANPSTHPSESELRLNCPQKQSASPEEGS